MLSDDEINALRAQLSAHRRTLAHLLSQQAQFSAGYIPAHVANGIAEARDEIRRIKAALRDAGDKVPDALEDEHADPDTERLEQARKLIEQGRFDEALTHLVDIRSYHRSALADDLYIEACYQKGFRAHIKGDYATAESALREVVALRPLYKNAAQLLREVERLLAQPALAPSNVRQLLRLALASGLTLVSLVAAIAALNFRAGGSSSAAATTTAQAQVAADETSTAIAQPTLAATVQPTLGPTAPPTAESQCPPTISFGERLVCSSNNAITVSFTAEAGDDVYIVVSKLPASDSSPAFAVIQPDGTPTDCAAKDAQIAGDICTLNNPGKYSMRVEGGENQQRGVYALFVQRLNNPGRAQPVVDREPIIGEISTTDEYDTYTITVATATTVGISVDPAEGLGPGLQVYEPGDGQRICDTESSARLETSCVLPEAGTYTLLIFDRRRGGVGLYELVVTMAESAPTA